MKVGIIGCGFIGRSVLFGMQRLFGDRVQPTAVLLRRQGIAGLEPEVARLSPFVTSLEELLSTEPDLVIECASHEAVRQYGCEVLRARRDLMVVSTGALADPKLYDGLLEAAAQGGARLRVVAGAVGGIDVLDAMRRGGLDVVHYCGTKPPAAWKGSAAESLVDLAHLDAPVAFFSGTAREAATQYPKNANVAATVALAGVGFERTEVTLVADPACTTNQHVIEARGAAGSFRFAIQAAPSGNARTSAIVGDSVCHAIGALVDPLAFL